MAEIFLSIIIEGVLFKASSLVVEQISPAWNTKSDITKLHNTLSTIKAVISDANEQQTRNHEVRDWLEKLKDAVYDIDDLLDDLSLSHISAGKSVPEKVIKFFTCSNSNPFVSRFKFGRRVKGLRMKLDEIAEDRKKFHFTEQAHLINFAGNNNGLDKVREQTHSFVRASDIIGRDKDRENIVELLLSSTDEEDNVPVIPIVGIGGLGKTSVVKLAYNDDRVIRSFDLGMWVSVNEDFSLAKLVERILKSATGESLGHLDMDQMQSRLAEVLSGKRYLLVLDDVWNEDRNKWMDLKELLMNCCSGSRIVVTTRSKAVATITSTTLSPYNLTGLSDDDCLSLFLKCAFRGPNDWLPNLLAIGKEIVKKCGGVPLAVKTLGSLLYTNTDEQEWLRIKDNDIWEIDQKQTDILPLLRLSYERLPSYLRPCFAYCSMLPKGVEIPREAFINLWMAQGFVPSLRTGNKYFNELLSRFCFQEIVEAFDGEVLVCRIHNLVHDLAQSVAAQECVHIKSDNQTIPLDKVRHVYLHDEHFSDKWSLLRLKKARSFRCTFKIKPFDSTFIEAIATNFRRLHILILNALELDELPSSIGGLKQLKYLDLSQNRNLKSLPKSLGKLVKLQTLNLMNCEKLRNLPRNFSSLISLTTLYLTCQQEIPLGRKAHPKSYACLQFLLLYNCDFIQLPSEGFEHLTCIRVLRIYDCSRLATLPNGIKHLSTLEKLWIWNCEELDLSEGEELEGLTSLESLLFMGLPKLVDLPKGLAKNVAETLKFFRIANCANFTAMPEWLLSFASLQRLYMEDCPNLCSLPDGLERLVVKVNISGCPKLA